jgi:hypothetical protein
MDYVSASRTMARKVDVKNEKPHVFARMADTTFWANFLITLSDYSVHQILFCYGYYMYYKRQKNRKGRPPVDEAAIAKECAVTSSHLLASRSCGLVFSAIGAGVGTIVWPGWGTLMLSSMAESAGGIMIDDGYTVAMAKLSKID